MTTVLTPYASVLNALDEMQRSKIYAVRAADLNRAENLIVHLATELESVKSKLDNAMVKLATQQPQETTP